MRHLRALLFSAPAPGLTRPKPSRLRTQCHLGRRQVVPVHCASCGMLLGAIARRRGVCPRCRARRPEPPAQAARTA